MEDSKKLNQEECAHLRKGRIDDSVPYECAKLWVENWKQKNPNGPFSFLFSREEVQKILDEGGIHVRVQLGINEAVEPGSIDYFKLLLIGAEVKVEESNGTIEYTNKNLLGPEDTIQDFAKPCPPYCPKDPGGGDK